MPRLDEREQGRASAPRRAVGWPGFDLGLDAALLADAAEDARRVI
jgi:hypothetical protein